MIRHPESQRIVQIPRTALPTSVKAHSAQQIAVSDELQEETVYPRMSRPHNVPLKVALSRKLKAFTEYNINAILRPINYQFGEGCLDLSYFHYALPLLHECTQARLANGLIKGRAYHPESKSFKRFRVRKVDQESGQVEGVYIGEEGKEVGLNKFYICFDFQNPQLYCKSVGQALQNRQRCLRRLRYSFYLDNMDLEQAPDLPKALLKGITLFTGLKLLPHDATLLLKQHYQQTMNQLLLNHSLATDPALKSLSVTAPTLRPKLIPVQRNSKIMLKKDNKKYVLHLKSFKKKMEELQSQSIYLNQDMVKLIQQIRSRMQSISTVPIFDLRGSILATQRFVSDNMLAVGYFTHFMEEKVINWIGSLVRQNLIENQQGWFKLQQGDRKMYLLSKLRRLFILIQQNMKTYLKDHIEQQLWAYSKQVTQRTPQSIKFDSFSAYSLCYTPELGQKQWTPMLLVGIGFRGDSFGFNQTRERLQELLVRNVSNVLSKVQKMMSPQSKALLELYSMFKDQYGVEIQIPFHNVVPTCSERTKSEYPGPQVNLYQFEWINSPLSNLLGAIRNAINSLSVVLKYLEQIALELDLKNLKAQISYKSTPDELVSLIHNNQGISDRLEQLLPGQGVDFGVFHIEYQPVKNQLKDILQDKQGKARLMLAKEYSISSLSLYNQLTILERQFNEQPDNIYSMVAQRDRLESLEGIVEDFKPQKQTRLYDMCEQTHTHLGYKDAHRHWNNLQKIKELYKQRTKKTQEYHQFKKNIIEQVSKQQSDLNEIVGLFSVTLQNVTNSPQRELYLQNYGKLTYLRKQYDSMRKQIDDVRYKEKHLNLEAKPFEQFNCCETTFLILQEVWNSVHSWEQHKQMWFESQLGSFELGNPEKILNDIINSFNRLQDDIRQSHPPELLQVILAIRREIEDFQGSPLRLLKILKKEGFTLKHLQKLGIYVKGELPHLTLQSGISMDMLDQIDQLQAVANDAWNEYYLEQTLDRVLRQLLELKYEIISVKDKKGAEIPLINNYDPLTAAIEDITMNLETVQFNPMKGPHEPTINQLFQRTLYITKSIESCQLLQKNFMEIHPIFDSTDVIKQLPEENRLFNKVQRSWVELLKYMKKIQSVYHSCNGQNVYEMTQRMITYIETIKAGLANYLQRKRQGCSRFYLLTDQQLYELFACSNDMEVLSTHVSKMFSAITGLKFNDTHIQAVISPETELTLHQQIAFKGSHLQEWIGHLERGLCHTIELQFENVRRSDRKWSQLLDHQCSQVVLMTYQMDKSLQIITTGKWKIKRQREQRAIRQFVDIKKSMKLNHRQTATLSSLMVLALYYSQKFEELLVNNITDHNHFDIKKLMKIGIEDEQICIKSIQTTVKYGYEYLGLVKRLVLTNLTERMQLIYMAAINHSLGGCAVGPAGTGKSETSKDIARLCGKTCLIYNCSQALTLDTLTRILKGMAVTGLWVCLDEFNRLGYQVLNMLAEQLSIIFKYRAIGVKMEVQLESEVISIKPDFHLCITYNPTYSGRREIPRNVLAYFRTVAMVNCDKQSICKLLFYSKGFKEAQALANSVNKLFAACQRLWKDVTLYDFGLRAMISVIDLTQILYQRSGKGDGMVEVYESIKILILPRLSIAHRQMLIKLARQYFLGVLIMPIKDHQPQAKDLSSIVKVRLGIILLGDIFSGKGTTLRQFEQDNPEYYIQHIHINALSVDQVYGRTDPATRLWKDGYLTHAIRTFLKNPPKRKCIISLKGVIFPEWIQNLNSVLDNSRSLSLPSGEILYMPETIKFIISCQHLLYASPATISRSCIISFTQKKFSQVLNPCSDLSIFAKIIQSFERVTKAVSGHCQYSLDSHLILHWVNVILKTSNWILSIEYFWHIVSQYLEGLLTEAGKMEMNKIVWQYVKLDGKIQDYMWDGVSWKAYKDTSLSYDVNIQPSSPIKEIVVKDEKYMKCFYMMNMLFKKPRGHNHSNSKNMFLLIGHCNSGKTNILGSICKEKITKRRLQSRVHFSPRTNSAQCWNMLEGQLSKKGHKRRGMLHGKELMLVLEDMNLPLANKYKVTQVQALFELLLQKGGCYDYPTLGFQNLQDIHLLGVWHIYAGKINADNEFLKHCLPHFVSPYSSSEISVILSKIVGHVMKNNPLVDTYQVMVTRMSDIIKDTVEQTKQLHHSQKHRALTNFAQHFTEYRKVLSSILQWKVNSKSTPETIQKLFAFQINRGIASSHQSPQLSQTITQTIMKEFNCNSMPYFHSVEQQPGGFTLMPHACHSVESVEQFMRKVENICDEYLLMNDVKNMTLAVFPQFCQLLCQLTRSLSLEKSHLVLIGLPKSGKKVLVRLCNYLIRGKIFSPPPLYDTKGWHESIKNSTKDCLSRRLPSVWMASSSQLKDDNQWQDLNTLLKVLYLPAAYSQADFEELLFLFQAQMIKRSMAVNKQGAIKLFKENLAQKFHIVLMLNSLSSSYQKHLTSYTSFSKQMDFYYLTPWPEEALLMIASQSLADPGLQNYLSLFPRIHELSKEFPKHKNVPQWDGLYLEMLHSFSRIHSESSERLKQQQNILRRSAEVIAETEQKLEQTRDEIKRLQPAIMILEKQTVKTIKSLNLQKANAETANEQLMKKETECNKIIAQTNRAKIKLEATNKEVEEQLTKAWENVYLVKSNHIAEIKSLMNPSDLIKIVVTAIVIILNEGEYNVIQTKSEDGFGHEQNYFQTAKRYIFSKDSKQITRMLTQYKKQNITKAKIALIQEKCLGHPRWNITEAKSANKAIFYFFLWAEAVVKYHRLWTETEPIRQSLSKATALLADKQKEIDIVKKELNVYELKIKQLSAANEEKTTKLQELSAQIQLFEKMLSRGYEILREIQSEKGKWAAYESQLEVQWRDSLGNSILNSTLLVYSCGHSLQDRLGLSKSVFDLLRDKGVAWNQQGDWWWIEEEEKIILKEIGVTQDEYIHNNIQIISKTQKHTLLIDPEQEAIRFLKQIYRSKGVLFTLSMHQHHPQLPKLVQKAIADGSVVFMEIESSQLPTSVEQVLNPTLRRNESGQEIWVEGRWIGFDDSFKMYLYTTTPSSISIELMSRLTTLDFSMTQTQLTEYMTTLMVALRSPEDSEQLQQLAKSNIKDNIELKSIQNKILQIFGTMTNCEDILKSQEVLQILSTSNRLHQQIMLRLEESKQKERSIRQRRGALKKNSAQLARIYFNMQRLRELSPLYNYSLRWFVGLYQKYHHSFSQVLQQQLQQALSHQLKVLAPLLIAQAQYPQLPLQRLLQPPNYVPDPGQYPSLPMNTERLRRVASKIESLEQSTSKQLLKGHPQMFHPLLTSPAENILQLLPDELSELQFFDKILLVDCFRPDCTLDLLKEWLKANMNTLPPQLPHALSIPQTPLLVLEPSDGLTSLVGRIEELQGSSERGMAYVNGSISGAATVQAVVESAFENDQWVVVEGWGDNQQTLAAYLIQALQEWDFRQKVSFRLWIILKDHQLEYTMPKLLKMCNKLTFEAQPALSTSISASFHRLVPSYIACSEMELNKKKFLLSQICTYHHLLNYKYHHKNKLWNRPINFIEEDLRMASQYLLMMPLQDIKNNYASLVSSVVYGGKITDQEDVQTVEMHLQEIISEANFDRSAFWQSVWGQDSFPKSPVEYQNYVKTQLRKQKPHFKNVIEQYGVNFMVTIHSKQEQYKHISDFFSKTVTQKSAAFNEGLMELINKIEQIMKGQRRQDFQGQWAYYYAQEQSNYSLKMSVIYRDLLSCINLTADQQLIKCIEDKIVPNLWGGHTLMTLPIWLELFIEGYSQLFPTISSSICEERTQKFGSIYHLDLTMDFNSLIQTLAQIHRVDLEDCRLIWYPESQKHQNSIKVNRWYVWNATYENQGQRLCPIPEGQVSEYYYVTLPPGYLCLTPQNTATNLKTHHDIRLYPHSPQYASTPQAVSTVKMPVSPTHDLHWLTRNKVHLTIRL